MTDVAGGGGPARCGLRLATVEVPVRAEGPLPTTVELSFTGPGPVGELRLSDGRTLRFEGWLELLTLLERIVDGER